MSIQQTFGQNIHKSLLDEMIESSLAQLERGLLKLKEKYIQEPIGKLSHNHPLSKEFLALQYTAFKKLCDDLLPKFDDLVVRLQKQLLQTVNIHENPPQEYTCSRDRPKPQTSSGPRVIVHKDLELVQEQRFNRLSEFVNFPKKVTQVKDLNLAFDSYFRMIIASSGITDNSLDSFCKAFYRYPNLQRLVLDLSSNSLSTQGAFEVAKCFTNLNHLKHLDFSIYNNKINHEGIQALMTTIGSLPSLQEISLNIACTSAGPKGFTIVGQTLFPMYRLRKVWLKAYDLGINDNSLKEFMLAFKPNNTLGMLSLDLRLNPFDRDLLKLFRADLTSKKMHNYKFITE